MNIGGINQNKIFSLAEFCKIFEKNKVLSSTGGTVSLSEEEINEKAIQNVLSEINKFLEVQGTHLEYQKHDILNQIIIKIVDNKTNTVVKEIPSEKILDMVVEMCELAGVLINKKA